MAATVTLPRAKVDLGVRQVVTLDSGRLPLQVMMWGKRAAAMLESTTSVTTRESTVTRPVAATRTTVRVLSALAAFTGGSVRIGGSRSRDVAIVRDRLIDHRHG